ncbi:MCE family protein [Mycolicibacterium sp. P9-22]|uniref:MCE family protein n=1 Tax=Mycolicibacterium sp. P9-22 TaxID=2024613 RepID=UPI0011ED62C3|nr:MCE family protein [Mycolicibacterium sp. P9-22]KAA0114729.1 MCE family protein [Mycolicibacterium sp. P9-22]
MLKYRGSKLVRTGLIGVVLMLLIISIGLQSQQILAMATSIRYQALFVEGGGLTVGNEVKVSGMTVGAVSDVELDRGKALVTFSVDSSVRMGSETTAHIRTGSLLGERVLTIEPAGPDRLRRADIIPVSRTSSPYSLTEAVSEFTSNTGATDTASINQSLDVLSETIDRVAPQLAPAFDGVSQLSKVINERDDSLRGLLTSAADVTGILADHSQQVNTLLLNANDLLGVLEQRRYAIVNLLANTSALAQQLSSIVADNEAELAPTLAQLNTVMEMLQRNRDNVGKALSGLAKYQITQGEAVNSGAYYEAFIGNLLPGPALQPFLDYALGFRRGVDAGQPPDNAGPRAEFPFPRNGIPGGSR